MCVCVCVCVRPASCSVLAEWEQYILQPCRDFPIIPQAAQRDAASTCDAGCRQPALYIYIFKKSSDIFSLLSRFYREIFLFRIRRAVFVRSCLHIRVRLRGGGA